MQQPRNQRERAAALPSGAGVMVAAGLGALFWVGAFALFW